MMNQANLYDSKETLLTSLWGKLISLFIQLYQLLLYSCKVAVDITA